MSARRKVAIRLSDRGRQYVSGRNPEACLSSSCCGCLRAAALPASSTTSSTAAQAVRDTAMMQSCMENMCMLSCMVCDDDAQACVVLLPAFLAAKRRKIVCMCAMCATQSGTVSAHRFRNLSKSSHGGTDAEWLSCALRPQRLQADRPSRVYVQIPGLVTQLCVGFGIMFVHRRRSDVYDVSPSIIELC